MADTGNIPFKVEGCACSLVLPLIYIECEKKNVSLFPKITVKKIECKRNKVILFLIVAVMGLSVRIYRLCG